MNRRSLWLALVALAAIVQSGILLQIVFARAALLRGGTEVRLATRPVDPRDLLRGDYVRLAYEVEEISDPAVLAASDADLVTGQEVYLALTSAPGALARPLRLTHLHQPRDGEVLLKARVVFQMPQGVLPDIRKASVNIQLPISRFYVPEGEGRAIETAPADRVVVVAAVDSAGRAAIKRLLIDDKPLYDEPPY